MIELAIIGCGAVVHENYARTLIGRSDYRVALVHDVNEDQAMRTADLLGASPVSLERIVKDAEAIIVTTPPSTHVPIVRQCIRSGRLILCEKPFAPSYRDAAAVVDEAEVAGAKLYVGQFRRTFPQLELARKLVAQGAIGRVAAFVASEGGRFAWRAVSGYTTRDPAGGVLWDTGSHTLDMALFASGIHKWRDPSVEVKRVERDKSEPSHDLATEFTLQCDGNRVEARLHLSRREGLSNLVRLIGEEGEIVFSVGLDNRVRLKGHGTSTFLLTERRYANVLECFDLETQRILLGRDAEDFAAASVLSQIKVLEAVAHA